MICNDDMDSPWADPASLSSQEADHERMATLLHTSPPIADTNTTTSRQSLLLQNRNARFSGKRLSISKLERKLSLRGSAKKSGTGGVSSTNSTRKLSGQDLCDRALQSPVQPFPSGILENIANLQPIECTSQMAGTELATHAIQIIDKPSATSSPLVYEHSPQDRSTSSSPDETVVMQLREVSGNQRQSPHAISPSLKGSLRHRKRKSIQLKQDFDAENYIQHIEGELQLAKDAIPSPTVTKSLQHQLKSAKVENDRLKREISDLRNAFETEVKSTIEHKTAIEVALKREIRTLQSDLECKLSAIKNLEYQHEEKRLDANIIDTLKATIEKLEQDKTSMENENRSMSKRNEVLSEILAMSPSKSHPAFELRSPTREKRPGRPMSMIIPRLPTSPISTPFADCPGVSATSPAFSTAQPSSVLATEIAHLSLQGTGFGDGEHCAESFAPPNHLHLPTSSRYRVPDMAYGGKLESKGRRDSSPSPFAIPLPMSPVAEPTARVMMKRKPRKFMSGSTQLKPLLLPALASDTNSQNSAGAVYSPGSMPFARRDQDNYEPESYFPSAAASIVSNESSLGTPGEAEWDIDRPDTLSHPHYQTLDEILANHGTNLTVTENESSNSEGSFGMRTRGLRSISTQLGRDPIAHAQWEPDHAHTECRSVQHFNRVSADNGRYDRTLPTTLTESPCVPWRAWDQVKLPRAHYRGSPESLTGSSPRLSIAIPEPLFSPLARRPKFSGYVNRDDGHFPTKQSSSRKRRQSRSSSSDVVVLAGSSTLKHQMLFPSNQSFGFTNSPLLPVGNSDAFHSFRHSPSYQTATYFRRSRTPLEIIQNRHFGAQPLAALTIRTICSTIAQCSAFVRDLKQDPLSLARRVIANAWFANWRQFGKLSWWVLGLFLPRTTPKIPAGWDWDEYDGDAIAQRCLEEQSHSDTSAGAGDQAQREEGDDCHNKQLSNEDMSEVSNQQHKPGWCKSVFLWGKFSFAIMLAVGGAVVKGPAEMLRDTDHSLPKRQRQATASGSACAACSETTSKANPQGHCDSDRIRKDSAELLRGYQSTIHMARPCGFGNPRPTSSSPPYFTFRSPDQPPDLAFPDLSARPPDDRTLRPAKSRKRHVGNLFDEPSTAGWSHVTQAPDHGWTRRQRSHQQSIDEDIMGWPPSPDFIRPEDSISIQNLSLTAEPLCDSGSLSWKDTGPE